ncbi:MAG: Nif3-like dinuclear metal center hexameric protein [Halobacteria archaeon]
MLNRIVEYLDYLLRNDEWSAIDASVNGLQVGSGVDVDKVVFAVDAAEQTIERAAGMEADLMVVHHGIIWGGLDRITGKVRNHLELLLENDLALYASHLPLDAHEDVGNNVLLLEELDGEPESGFGNFGGKEVGYVGELDEPREFDDIVYELNSKLNYDSTTLRFGDDTVEKVAVMTGSGADTLPEAARAGADLFISGEPKHKAHHEARELGINAVFAGHYQTETFGVRALRKVVESKFDVETEFIHEPTEV